MAKSENVKGKNLKITRVAGFVGIVLKSRSHDEAKTLAATNFVIIHRIESCDRV